MNIKILYISILSLFLTSFCWGQVTPSEKAALQAFYTATGGDNWINNTGWDFNTPVTSSWHGVIVENGNVTMLLLEANGLSGDLPTNLSDLLNLKYLRLSNNSLTGQIPASLGVLSELIDLKLGNNNLTGTIPESLGDLNSLKELHLNINSLTGEIPASLGNLNDLVRLYLNANDLTGTIPSSLGGLSNLLALYLYGNELTGSIPSSLGNLSTLIQLYLGDNNLTGGITPELGQISNLLELNLSNNDLGGAFPPELGQLTKLRYLELSDCGLVGSLPPEIGQMSQLGFFKMSNNNITAPIPAEIGQLSNMFTLNLTNCNIPGNLPSSMGQLFELQLLVLSNNNLTGSIPIELIQLPKLRGIGLSGNNLSNQIPNFTSSNVMLANQASFNIKDNRFRFIDFEQEYVEYSTQITSPGSNTFTYSPQAKIDEVQTITKDFGSSVTFTMFEDNYYSNNNTYQWYKGVYPNGIAISGATNREYTINGLNNNADGGVYYCLANNSIISGLTLEKNSIELIVSESPCNLSAHIITNQDFFCIGSGVSNSFTVATNDMEVNTYTWSVSTILPDGTVDEVLFPPTSLSDTFFFNFQEETTYLIQVDLVYNNSNCSGGVGLYVNPLDCDLFCTPSNPKSEEVEDLLISVLQDVVGKLNVGQTIPEGYSSQDIELLSGFVTDYPSQYPVGIYNIEASFSSFTSLLNGLNFSFSPDHEKDIDIFGDHFYHLPSVTNLELDLTIYTSSEEYINLAGNYTEQLPSPNTLGEFGFKQFKVRHIDFCPEDVISCTENNPNSEVVEGLFINLLQHLLTRVQAGDTPAEINGTTPPELIALLPYVTDPDKGVINNFDIFTGDSGLISRLSFSFSPSEIDDDVWFNSVDPRFIDAGGNLNIDGIDLDFSEYVDFNTELNIYLTPLPEHPGKVIKGISVKHVDFCPDEIVDPCDNITGQITSLSNTQQLCLGAEHTFTFSPLLNGMQIGNWSLIYIIDLGIFSFPIDLTGFFDTSVSADGTQFTVSSPFPISLFVQTTVCDQTFTLPVTFQGDCGDLCEEDLAGTITANTDEYCLGDDYSFYLQTTVGIDSFEWSVTQQQFNGPIPVQVPFPIQNPNSSTLETSFLDEGNYTISVTIGYNGVCEETFTLPITVIDCNPCIDGLTGTITANTNGYCVGNDYDFYIQTTVGIDSFQWSVTQQQFNGPIPIQVPFPVLNPNNSTLDTSFLDEGNYTISVTIVYNGDCEAIFTLPITVMNCSCTDNNPNSELVKQLYINLLNRIRVDYLAGDPIADGYNPAEMIALSPYITAWDSDEVYDFNVYEGTMYLAFRKFDKQHVHSDVEFADWNNFLNTGTVNIDLINYTPNLGLNDNLIEIADSSIIPEFSHKVRHINFCPDEIVPPCIETGENVINVQDLFIELVNELIGDYQSNGSITDDNPEQLQELAPYIQENNPRIYNFSYSGPNTREYTFSFSANEETHDVKIVQVDDLGTPGDYVNTIGAFPYLTEDEYTTFELSWDNGIQSMSNEVKHIDFCSEELDPCAIHVALVVDESGSLDGEEIDDIRDGLREFVIRSLNSQTKISITWMADSDDPNRRTDHIGPVLIEDGNVLNILNEIDTYGNRYGTVNDGVSASSDFWGGALQRVNNFSGEDIPKIVIVITDGAQTDDVDALKTVIAQLREKTHLYFYGVDNEYYVSGDTSTQKLSSNNDPNMHPELSIYKEANTASNAKSVVPSLFTSLSYLYNDPLYIPQMGDVDIATADYYPYENFYNFGNGLTMLYNLLVHSDVTCATPLELCDDCFSFQPIPLEKYWISAWVKEDLNIQVKDYTDATINVVFLNNIDEEISTIPFKASGNIIDGWQRIAGQFQIPDGTLTLKIELSNENFNIPIYFDDIRVHPLNGNMKSFVYDPITFRLMAELDENNYSTRYEYDKEGGLVRVKKETSKGVKTIQETRSGTVIKPQN